MNVRPRRLTLACLIAGATSVVAAAACTGRDHRGTAGATRDAVASTTASTIGAVLEQSTSTTVTDRVDGSSVPDHEGGSDRRRAIPDDISQPLAWAVLAVRERHPEAANLTTDPSFPSLLVSACEVILDGEALAVPPDQILDAVRRSVLESTWTDARDALTDAVATYLFSGGCGTSPYVDAVIDGLRGADV